jgi:hypothetical protein
MKIFSLLTALAVSAVLSTGASAGGSPKPPKFSISLSQTGATNGGTTGFANAKGKDATAQSVQETTSHVDLDTRHANVDVTQDATSLNQAQVDGKGSVATGGSTSSATSGSQSVTITVSK